MRNMWQLFLGDMKRLMKNPIAAIVVIGLALVPPLYAWFTTAGFWDPYSNTGNLKVAVASQDEGYESDLLPMGINAGDDILDELRKNDQFDWVFVDENEAVEGVKSGEYYAAIVIPEDFSADLMTVFSEKVTHASIEYYSNQKLNAIAPRVTNTGASTLEQQIDETFAKTVSTVALHTTSNLMTFMNGEGILTYAQTMSDHLRTISGELRAATTEVTSFAQLVDATANLVDATASLLTESDDAARQMQPAFSDAEQGLKESASALGSVSDQLTNAMDQSAQAFDTLASDTETAFESLESAPREASGVMEATSADVADLAGAYQDVRDALSQIDPTTPVLAQLDAVIAQLDTLKNDLDEASSHTSSASADIADQKARALDKIESAKSLVSGLKATYESEIGSQVSTLETTLGNIRQQGSVLAGDLAQATTDLEDATGSLSDNLHAAKDALDETARVLGDANAQLGEANDALIQALDTKDLNQVRTIIGTNPAAIAQFLSAPTKLETHVVYAMDNNGSAMSPFYTTLSLWIGAVFMVALMQVNVSKKRIATLDNPTPCQLYIGRYGVFCLIALMQATIVCVGNVFFLGVECTHFWLYLVTGWIIAVVFSSMVYTLTVVFGNVGKAIAIVGLVMQLAGSGGLMPIQMAPEFFQAVYPWLPFTHAMEALESCMAGIYGNQLWLSWGCLGLFLLGTLFVGLVLRKPTIKMNEYFNKKLDETKLV
ncbi:YhgE/Pip domain-containing protein [Adlercreutzia agrestimuris]|uniref:YhgE/Pip domain-containing protein n=1 Tax=Adlercreutzia agrestimuris TaxID=2941324 RepID=UPI0020414F01|nr:YhgE/Pip domain-containing protein [Adlercreutzia agrestimuris]